VLVSAHAPCCLVSRPPLDTTDLVRSQREVVEKPALVGQEVEHVAADLPCYWSFSALHADSDVPDRSYKSTRHRLLLDFARGRAGECTRRCSCHFEDVAVGVERIECLRRYLRAEPECSDRSCCYCSVEAEVDSGLEARADSPVGGRGARYEVALLAGWKVLTSSNPHQQPWLSHLAQGLGLEA
jgi:hypothetical protein